MERNNLCNIGKGHYEEQFCEFVLNLEQWLRRKCHLKTFYLELRQPLVSVEQNHLCNFSRWHYIVRNNSLK